MDQILNLTGKCKKLVSETQKLRKTISHQKWIKKQQVVPEKYKPHKLDMPSNSIQLQQDFESQYSSLFLKHLSKVLLENEVTLGIKTAHLENLLTTAEKHFINSGLPPDTLSTNYYQFIKRIGIEDHTPSPILLDVLRNQPSTQRLSTRKRKAVETIAPLTEKHPHLAKTTFNPSKQSDLVIHNFSSFCLSDTDISILSRGLSFTPTPSFNIKDELNLLQAFDMYAVSLRHKANSTVFSKHPSPKTEPSHPLYRPMGFLKLKQPTRHEIHSPSSFASIENYIYDTKELLNEKLPNIYKPCKRNMSSQQGKALKKLKSQQHQLTIKPADKNLGIVLLDTEDYINECLKHLSTPSYIRVSEFPPQLKQLLQKTLEKFSRDLTYNIISARSLYHHLQPQNVTYRVPQFYGIPKIHKSFILVPPIRPIVSQCGSLLSTTAKFIDYTLQPLAKSYPDYLHNSTALINILENTTFPRNTSLVSLDIISLFPSIPQSECLSIIHQELLTHSTLFMFNPNLC